MCAFFDQHYHPGAAILVISGKLDESEVAAVVAHYFGTLEGRGAPAPIPVSPPKLAGTQSRYTLPVSEATAFIAMPGAPFGDEDVYESFVLAEVAEHVRGATGEIDFISDVSFGTIGGYQAPLQVISVSVRDPARLEEAVDRIFKDNSLMLGDLDKEKLGRLRNQHLATLLQHTEPFSRRARLFADYLHFTDHTELVMRDFRLLESMSVADVRRRAGKLLRREHSHVLYVYPHDGEVAEVRRPRVRRDAGGHFEIWQRPVNPEEADRPLPLPTTRVQREIRELTLENGLRVLLAPSLSYPLVDMRLVVSGGWLHESDEGHGVSLLASDLLSWYFDRAMSTDEYLDFTKIVHMGVTVPRRRGELTTTFLSSGLAAFADGMLWAMHSLVSAGRDQYKALERTQDDWQRAETASVLDRRRRWQAIADALFGAEHPYARRASRPASVAHLSIDDLERFHEQHHVMGDATLIVTGQFDATDMASEIRRLFGSMPAKAPPPLPAVPPVARRSAPVYLAFEDTTQAQTGISMGFVIEPGFREQHAARAVLEEILHARLQKKLRHEMAVSYDVGVRYVSRAAGPGYLAIEADVNPARAGEAFQAMREDLDRLRAGDFVADFVRARRKVLQRMLADALHSGSLAGELELIATYGLPEDYFDRLAERVAALRMDEVRALIAAELPPTSAVVAAKGPPASVQAMYETAGVTASPVTAD